MSEAEHKRAGMAQGEADRVKGGRIKARYRRAGRRVAGHIGGSEAGQRGE